MKIILCCVVTVYLLQLLCCHYGFFFKLLQPDDYALLRVDSRLKNSQLSLVSFPLKTIILYEFEGKKFCSNVFRVQNFDIWQFLKTY